MAFSMIIMVLALAIAGIVQVYLQRVLGMDYLTTQGFMKLWYAFSGCPAGDLPQEWACT